MIRRIRQTLLALVIGLLWTIGLMRRFGLQFNLANVWGLPLIIGASAEFGLNVVLRYLEGRLHGGPLVARSTVMAVALNGITTMVGFGSLMVAPTAASSAWDSSSPSARPAGWWPHLSCYPWCSADHAAAGERRTQSRRPSHPAGGTDKLRLLVHSCGTVMMIWVSPAVLRKLLKRTTEAMIVGWLASSVR
jgi:hypothetical protein